MPPLGTILLAVFFLLCFPSVTNAQNFSDLKEKPYRAWSYSMEGNYITQGYLLHHNDSIIVLKNFTFQNEILIPLSEVHRLRFRRKNSSAAGMLYGALAGLSLGIISGFIAGDDPPPPPSNCQDITCAIVVGLTTVTLSAEDKALLGGLFGMSTGAGIGALLGASKGPPVYIYGNPAAYQSAQTELVKYTLKF